MQNYRPHLPHWQPDGAEFFVTWRLHGSLPAGHTGADFVTVDRELERSIGPRRMQDPRVANCVMETLIESEQTWKLCTLSAWVVMLNHVRALLHPVQKLSKAMLVIKSASARRANRLLDTPDSASGRMNRLIIGFAMGTNATGSFVISSGIR